MNIIIVILVILIIFVFFLIMNIYNKINDIILHFRQVYLLLDVLSQDVKLSSKMMFDKLRNLKCYEVPKNEQELYEFFRKIIQDNYVEIRKIILTKLNDETVYENREHLLCQLSEVDAIYNFINTIDNNSSKEYIHLTFNNIDDCLQRLIKIGVL